VTGPRHHRRCRSTSPSACGAEERRDNPGTLPTDLFGPDLQDLLRGLHRGWGGHLDEHGGAAAVIAQNRVQARLVALCSMLPDPAAAPALTVLAAFAWWRGNGALARVALERALRC